MGNTLVLHISQLAMTYGTSRVIEIPAQVNMRGTAHRGLGDKVLKADDHTVLINVVFI